MSSQSRPRGRVVSRTERQHRPCRLLAAVEPLEGRALLSARIAGSPVNYATIQAAVDAASAGATITVDPGVYPELVSVFKPLTIKGAAAGVDARGSARGNPASESVVSGTVYRDGQHSSAFYVAADDVTIDGFTVQDQTSTTTYGAGLTIAPKVSGTKVLDDVFRDNVAGIYLANSSPTDTAVIEHDLFVENNQDGGNGGRGIYSDGGVSGGTLTGVVIDSNVFQRNYGGAGTTGLEAAIALESATPGSQANVSITYNVFDNNGKAVLLVNTDRVNIEDNVVTETRDWYSGALRFEGGVTNVNVQSNTLYDNPGPAIRVDNHASSADNSGVSITRNTFYHNGNITQHEALIVAAGQYAGPLDARNNFWGSPSGSSGDGNGNGDALLANGNQVLDSPVATAPTLAKQLPYQTLPAALETLIQSEYYNQGGEGVAYHSLDAQNSPGWLRPYEGVNIEPTTDAGGGYDVTSTKAGEWLDYTVNAAQAGAYFVSFRVASPQAVGGTFHLEVDGKDVTGPVAVPDTGGWQSWQTLTRSGVSLSAGRHVLRLVFDANGSGGVVANVNWVQFSTTPPVPSAPTGLVATPQGPTGVALSWRNGSPNPTGFVVERLAPSTGAWVPIATTAPGVTSYTDLNAPAGKASTYRVVANWSGVQSPASMPATATTPAVPALTYLSDLPFLGTPANGSGPVERDASNGGPAAGDGNPLSLHGVDSAKGLGTDADSRVSFALGGHYARFRSLVGIDDEAAGRSGPVEFLVYGDGRLLDDSGVMVYYSPTRSVDVSVAGVQQLTLQVVHVGANNGRDHADWAAARLTA